MPFDDTEVILPPVHYPAAPERERRPVPWKQAAAVVAVGAPLAAWVAVCAKVILVVWG